MAKYIRNISLETKVYQGREILAGDFFLITQNLESKYSQDLTLISDLANNIVKMSSNGTDNIPGSQSDHIDFLKGMLAANVNIGATPSFTSKTITTSDGSIKKLHARNTGFQQALIVGTNVFSYTAIYPWVKMIGVEIINCEALDIGEFKVFDTPAGTYSGVPNLLLNQFGYTLNLPKDFYSRSSPFDADLYQGMKLEFTYVSISAKTIGINMIMNEVK